VVQRSPLWNTFTHLPTGLRLAVAMNVVHAIIVTMFLVALGGSDTLNVAVGEILLAGIAAYAVLRPMRHGWGTALFVTAGTLLGETFVFRNALSLSPLDDARTYTWILYVSANVPLMIALAGLSPTSSREPFRHIRGA
jgi:hypothetical protein